MNVLLLGIVSLLADLSSEMMIPILPMYITTLGGSAFVVGLTGGLGDSISSMLKVFSGYWSDRTGKREPFVVFGYGVSALAKLGLALSTAWQHILIFRSVERTGKGLRDAPRDAVIADSTAPEVRGKAFGIHRAMDTTGAIGGSLSAFLLFWVFGLEFKTIVLICAIVAFASLVPFVWMKDVEREPQKRSLGLSFRALPTELKYFVFVATVFALGNFTSWFFVLRASDFFGELVSERAAVAIAIALYCLFNVVVRRLLDSGRDSLRQDWQRQSASRRVRAFRYHFPGICLAAFRCGFRHLLHSLRADLCYCEGHGTGLCV